ncbi:MAG: copper resistance system multicopper oxidase [Pseudomonadota bacterium]
MKEKTTTALTPALANPPRRKFLHGIAAGGVVLGMAPWTKLLAAAGLPVTQQTLSGTEFDLTIAKTLANFTGKPRMATTINGTIPGPILRWREGETVTIRVKNELDEYSSIHWHGILLPYQMDGVPGLSYKGIAPGETFTYQFKVQQSGTYWYHSHTGFQEQEGMYGAIVIEPAVSDTITADRDYVISLSDWTDEDPMRVFKNLKTQGGYYNFNQPTAMDFFKDVSEQGWAGAVEKRRMWNEMRMSPADLADVSAYTYTYLLNGSAPASNWTGVFKPGERVRLRIINSSAMTFFDVRIPGLQMTVVQADGQAVMPVSVDEIRIGVAETYDVLVTPSDEAYTIFAQSMDRTGYARGTLAQHEGLSATVPALDKPEHLTMGDMMGSMAGMSGMNHGGHDMPKADGMSGMDHGAMAMDHSKHDMAGMSGMDHSKHGMAGMAGMSASAPPVQVRHAKTEYGPSVDMRVDTPRTSLDDPGVGLRNNGRRVLTYADLHSLSGIMDTREAEHEIELHLTGNMERYTWSLDGLEFGKSTPVHFPHNKRIRIVLVNDTMMSHPMHLHGMWSELETPGGGVQVRKHTIIVQPAQRVSFLVTADALGRWAWHCHLLFHMDAGMFREVVVA